MERPLRAEKNKECSNKAGHDTQFKVMSNIARLAAGREAKALGTSPIFARG